MLLDIEKISYVMSNRKVQDKYTELFTQNLKSINKNDLADIYSIYKEMKDATLQSENWESINLVEHHERLHKIINQLYNKILSFLNYDFEAKYTTEKVAICISFCNFLNSKKAVF